MKIAVLPRYGRLGASSRLRLFQYVPVLDRAGITTDLRPFLDDAYLHDLYAGRSTLRASLRAYARQRRTLRDVGAHDLIWLEKEALPWLPWAIERRALPRAVPLVTDYDDAVFHRYDLHRAGLVRRVLGRKIDQVMAQSTLVMAGNAYLAARARDAGAAWVEIVPTVVDTDHYSIRERSMTGNPVIGWIGTPSTWTEYMAPILPLLTETATAQGARLLAVGAGRDAQHSTSAPMLDILPWSEDTEVARIQDMDIGIMPLTDTPWAQGKCGYKLIQYMACGLPVIASPVGVNSEIVRHGVNGFLASTQAEWRDALTRLLSDADLRARMGQAGRKSVEENYSLQVWGPRVADLLARAAATGPKHSTGGRA